MDQAVEDGIGVSRVADQRMPLTEELAGDDGGAAAVAVLEDDLQEVVAGCGVERLKAPIIEDEEIDATERAHETEVASIAAHPY
jgi:hypothetical protein